MPAVVRSLEIKAPPSAIWRWFADEESLRRWFLPTIDIDLRVGGTFRSLGADSETTVSGTVLELVPEGRLVLSWFEEEAGWVHPARLVLELQPTATGTLVTLIHDGFAGIGTSTWQRTEEAYERGADRHLVLQALAAVAMEAHA